MNLLDEQQKAATAAINEAYRLGYAQARREALDAAHEVVLLAIRNGGIFSKGATERAYKAVLAALDRSAP